MTLDIAHFTPGMSLLGGLLIGTASALFILANGRIAGISGILGGLLRPSSDDVLWRLAFILGLIMAAPLLAVFVAPVVPTIEAHRRSSSRHRHTLRRWLHERPWGLWLIAFIASLINRHTRLHGQWHGHRICDASLVNPRVKHIRVNWSRL
jgi:uncharacterized membrane protein YedE/YeeE